MPTDRDLSLVRAALEAAAKVASSSWSIEGVAAAIRALPVAAIAATVPEDTALLKDKP